MFVARGRRKVAHRRCAMSLPEGHEHRHIAPRWGAVPSAVCSTNIQLLTELEGMASHNVPNSRALCRDSLLILSVLSMTFSRQTPGGGLAPNSRSHFRDILTPSFGIAGADMTSTLRFNSADLESFPDDGKRYEIIDGELYVSKQPTWYHQDICSKLVSMLL